MNIRHILRYDSKFEYICIRRKKLYEDDTAKYLYQKSYESKHLKGGLFVLLGSKLVQTTFLSQRHIRTIARIHVKSSCLS